MDYTLSVLQKADGSAIIWCPALGAMASFDSWANAWAYWGLIGVGSP